MAAAYPDAINVHRPQLQRMYSAYFADNSLYALLFPTSPVLPAPIDPVNGTGTLSIDGGPPVDTFTTTIRNMGPGSSAGVPSLSLPAGMSARRTSGRAEPRRTHRQRQHDPGHRHGNGIPSRPASRSAALTSKGRRPSPVHDLAFAGARSGCRARRHPPTVLPQTRDRRWRMGSRPSVAAGEAGDGARFAALVAPTFAPVRVRPLVDGTFHSSVRSAAAGDVRVSVVGGSPCVVARDADLIHPTDPAFLSVTLQRAGRADGRAGRAALPARPRRPGQLRHLAALRSDVLGAVRSGRRHGSPHGAGRARRHPRRAHGHRRRHRLRAPRRGRRVVREPRSEGRQLHPGRHEPQQGVPRGRDRLPGHRRARRRRTAGRGRRPRRPGPRPLPLAPVRSGAHRRVGGTGLRHLGAVPAQGAGPDRQLAVGLDPQAAARADLPRPRRRVAARAHRRRHRVPVGDGRRRPPQPGVEDRVRHDRERDPPVAALGARRPATAPPSSRAQPADRRPHQPPAAPPSADCPLCT